MFTLYRRMAMLVCWLLLGMSMPVMAQGLDNTLPDTQGQVVFVGGDYNIYTRDFLTGETSQLTDDASSNRHYQWPTWSFDGRLAYFCCDLQIANDFGSYAYVSGDGKQAGTEVYRGTGEAVIYAYWSPATCGDDNCLDLALLINNIFENTLTIELVRDTTSVIQINTMGIGSPFYYSWSPQGNRIITHRNSRRVDIYDLTTGDYTQLTSTSSGQFQAPDWSPVDDRLLYGERGEQINTIDLMVAEPGQPATALVDDIRGLVSFAWSPDGQYVAYRIATNTFGSVFVVDATTGEIVSRSENNVVAFFWSPDSQRLAYLRLPASEDEFDLNAGSRIRISEAQQQTPAGLTWMTLDIETGLNRTHTTFLPTQEMVYLLLYFDQFERSHRIWSPDSTHIVYSEIANVQPLLQTVNVLDVTGPGSVPITIGEGVLGIWSFR